MRPRHLALVLLLVQAPTSTQFGRGIEAPLDPFVPPGAAGPIVLVPAAGDLQAALDAAVPGTTIRLASGGTYTGHFILRSKAGVGDITVRAGDDVTLPPGQRVGP